MIITGFLGAGKTTLMRHLLTSGHGMKIAAMVNDFAALNIDAALIADVTDDTTALANGCICCSISGGIACGLAEITSREEPVDAVLIEASDVSDPAGIAQVAGTVEGIMLDCIVTVVDAAENTTGTTNWEFLLKRQVAPANPVLLSRTDLVAQSDVDALAARLRALAPAAQILRTIDCAVPPVVIFEGASAPAPTGAATTAHPGHGFTMMILRASKPIVRAEIDKLLEMMPSGILRFKGFVQLADTPENAVLLQGVGRRWNWHDAPEALGASRLVVIGQSDTMNPESILQHFAPLGFEHDEADS